MSSGSGEWHPGASGSGEWHPGGGHLGAVSVIRGVTCVMCHLGAVRAIRSVTCYLGAVSVVSGGGSMSHVSSLSRECHAEVTYHLGEVSVMGKYHMSSWSGE